MTRESTYGLEPGSLFFVRFHRPTIPKTKKNVYITMMITSLEFSSSPILVRSSRYTTPSLIFYRYAIFRHEGSSQQKRQISATVSLGPFRQLTSSTRALPLLSFFPPRCQHQSNLFPPRRSKRKMG